MTLDEFKKMEIAAPDYDWIDVATSEKTASDAYEELKGGLKDSRAPNYLDVPARTLFDCAGKAFSFLLRFRKVIEYQKYDAQRDLESLKILLDFIPHYLIFDTDLASDFNQIEDWLSFNATSKWAILPRNCPTIVLFSDASDQYLCQMAFADLL